MMYGIEKINLYAGWLATDAVALAKLHGKEESYATQDIMVGTRAVIPPYEDAVTLAVNAARSMLTDEDRNNIELVIVASESGVDFGKPISSWVHRFCGLPDCCRNFEVKHACYGATAALKMSLALMAASGRPDAKALVISSDLTRPKLTEDFDYIGGGCAVALLVSAKPDVLAIDLLDAGYWSHEIADTFRPTAGTEISDGQTSVFSYLDSLDGAYEHFAKVIGFESYDDAFKRHIYHTPFPGMAYKAHASLLGNLDVTDKAKIQANFDAKVRDGISIARRIGTAYGASNFVSLLSMLNSAENLVENDPISLFAYGSGCQSEFYRVRVGPHAVKRVRELELDEYLENRRHYTVEQYLENEETRAANIDQPGFDLSSLRSNGTFADMYEGRELLVLSGLEAYRREYVWS
jgi:hydroxymethylglutaryl-CoA synthase